MSTVLSDTTAFLKYARYDVDLGRRETWEEIVERVLAMHVRQITKLCGPTPFDNAEAVERKMAPYEELVRETNEAFKLVMQKRIVPSMRSMQFGGEAIEKNNVRIYNCAFLPMDSVDSFGEALFLLLSGTGVGYSVQRQHVAKLPRVSIPSKTYTYKVEDSIEGWASALKHLLHGYLGGQDAHRPQFDFSKIRPKGAPLKTAGGYAPGPEPLKKSLEAVERVLIARCKVKASLEMRRGDSGNIDYYRLTPLDCHDIVCHMADCVAAGGIRRSALIALFSADDQEMLRCKSGDWWKENVQRSRANNSVVISRDISSEAFMELWQAVEDSHSGEPGFYFSNNFEMGANPCVEIALQPFQFCNICDINASVVASQEELEECARAAALIGTLQASYTDFPYLRTAWSTTTRGEALLGVGITGIGSGRLDALDLRKAARAAVDENERVAKIIGIAPAARVTTVKPSGTASLVLGCASGIHAWHAPHYIRRIRVGNDEAIAGYFRREFPELIEGDAYNPASSVISFPVTAPEGSTFRDEPVEALLERILRFNREWIGVGHRSGENRNNVSATVSIKDGEWAKVGQWMYDHRHEYHGISVLPYDGGSYKQAPFEDCTAEKVAEMERILARGVSGRPFDVRDIREEEDRTDPLASSACDAESCVRE